jgi:hypothetical protein
MKKSHVIGIAATLIVTIIIVFYYREFFNGTQEQNQQLLFDNSKPGLWKVKAVKTSLNNPKLNAEINQEVCITEEIINSSIESTLPQKFGIPLGALVCSVGGERKNNNEADFNFKCEGENKANNRKVSVSVSGSVVSQENRSLLTTHHVLTNNVDPVVEYDMVSESIRIGDCKK